METDKLAKNLIPGCVIAAAAVVVLYLQTKKGTRHRHLFSGSGALDLPRQFFPYPTQELFSF